MKIIRKLFKWAAGSIAILFVLLLLALLLAPRLINLELVKQNVLDRVSEEIGGRLSYQKADILFLPRPYLTIRQARMTIPDSLEGSLSLLKVYPEILPLLRGQIRLSRLDVEDPRIQINLKQRLHRNKKDSSAMSYGEIRETVLSALTIPVFHTPGLTVRIKKGQLTIRSKTRSAFIFRAIKARIRRTAGRLNLKILCTSNIWEEISLAGRINPVDLTGSGQVRLKQFRPHLMTQFLFPESPVVIKDSQMDLNLNFDIADPEHMRIELRGTGSSFHFRKGPLETVLKGNDLHAVIRVSSHTTLVSLDGLKLDKPLLTVSGNLYYNRSEPEIRIDLSGVGIDADSLRKTALTLAGDSETVRLIFDVIRGGNVPIITVNARGKTLADLDVENFLIKGNISEGRIYIPGAELHLEHVKGDATISEGILQGTNLKAQLGNSFGSNGELTLGLIGKSPPFHLDIETRADVAQLHSILLRLVANEIFRRELDQLSEISGEASGKLILGEKLDDLNVTAIVSNAVLFANYTRIPFPVVITNGRYYIDETRCAVKDIDALIGESSFSGLSIEFDWVEKAQLEVAAGESEIVLAELVKWLSSFDFIESYLRQVNFLNGTATLPGFHLKGPLNDPARWLYSASGEVENLEIQSPFFPDTINAGRGQFEVVSAGDATADVTVSPFDFKWGRSVLELNGNARVTNAGIEMDADLSVDLLNWEQLNKIGKTEQDKPAANDLKGQWSSPLKGILRVSTAQMDIIGLTFKPVAADIKFNPDEILIDISRANLCGIAVPGSVKLIPRTTTLAFQPVSRNQNLGQVIDCIWNEEGLVNGAYNLSGKLAATVTNQTVAEALRGNLEMNAGAGRIYRLNMLAKILAMLNFTEIFRGKIPDIFRVGFAYNSMRASGYFQDAQFILKEGIIEGSSMTIYVEGSFDLIHETMDLKVLVSPLKTIDSLLKALPLLRKLAKKGLVAFLYSVSGKWDDYEVVAVTPPREEIDPLP